MKKILFFAALVLGMASCQTEPEGLDVMVGGEQEVMLNVSLPESTRSASSAGFDFSDFENNGKYDLRFILEIAYNGTVVREVKTSETTSATFPVRLVPGRNYTFTVWADLVNEGSQADLYYNILSQNKANNESVLENIMINIDEWTPNVEARDAYYGRRTLLDTESIAQIGTITLFRPFAKVRVVATDIADVTKFGIEPDNATVKYTAKLPTTFNAVKGTVADSATTISPTIAYDIVADAYTENTNELTVFADYIFVPENGTISFNLDVKDGNAYIKENSFSTAIPVEANKVTSIVGDVLTEGGNVSITVDGALGQKETINYVDNAESLQEAINNSEEGESVNITLGGDINLGALAGILSTRAGEPTYGLLIPAGKELTLDLNGFTISQSKTQTTAYSMIENRGTLTIKDSSANKTGKFSYADNGQGGNYVSNTINNSGVLTIDGGTIENSSSATVASNGYPHPIDNSGTLIINGGTFTNNANYSSMRIWCTTDDNTIVTINGGTFNGSIDFQTPSAAANKGTLTIYGGTFNADTYTKCAVRLLGFGADVDEMNGYILGGHFNGAIALKNWSGSELNSKVFDITGGTFTTAAKEGTDIALVNDDYAWVETENGLWTVALKNVIAKIGEVEYRTLQKAFDAVEEGANTIVLVDDVDVNAAVVLAEGKTATLDLNGKTLTATDYAIENYGTLTINGNGTITGVVYGENGTTTVENGKFNPADGGKYVFLNSQGGTLTINGGTINGGSSYPIYSYDKDSSLVINDVTVNATFGCVNAYGTDGSVVINGGTYKMTGVEGKTSHIAYFSNVDATINGGTFQKTGDINMSGTGGGGICAIYGAKLTINGGNFAGDYADVYDWGGKNANGRAVAISITGGTYTFKPSFVADDCVATEDNGIWTVVRKPDVAKIGEVGYTSLAKAVAAIQDGETITLVADEVFTENNYYDNGGWKDGLGYSGDKSFTIDLNGNTIRQNGALNDYLIWIKNDGSKANTITLKNGTLDAGTTAYCAFATASSNKQKMTINLEDISLVGNNSNGAVAKIRGGAELNVKSGTVITGKNNYVGIEAVGNNTVVNIYDNVYIYQNGTGSDVGGIVGASYNATMNIYGGYGKSAKCGIIVMSTGATINVSGGEWIANNDGTVATDNKAVLASQNNRYETGWACKSILNVTGGTFKGGYNCYGMGPGVEPDDAQINIKGGNFNADPASYVVAGYEAVEENGAYNIIKAYEITEEGATIYSKGGMFWFANEVNVNGNGFSGKTVKLAADINLENAEWTPVGQTGGYGIATYFKGVFDGNNKTINNLKITTTNAGKNYAAGLFGFIDAGAAEIKNLTIDGATVNGHHWTGVINGYLTGKITNCTVKNATVICSHTNDDACGDKASTIVGYINSGKVSNCHAEKCVVKAGRDAGQIVGAAKAEYVENCTATNVTVSANGDCTGANIRNEVIGRLL